jgi:hypothetical protein
MPVTPIGAVAIKEPAEDMIATVDTNRLRAATIPGITSPFSVAGEPDVLTSYLK